MYKIQVSTFSPFWNNSDINYPDFEKFDNQSIFTIESESWQDIPNGSINWMASNSAWVQIDVVQYKINYLRVIDDYTNKIYYFFVVDFFDMTMKTVKLNLELDNWMTYGKDILDHLKNENPIIFFNKKHMNRYSIMDNFSIDAPATIIDKQFAYLYSEDIPVYNIVNSSANPEFLRNQLSMGNIPNEPISYTMRTLGSGINSISIGSFNDSIKNRVNEYLDMINRLNIRDLGSTLDVKYIITNTRDNLHYAHYFEGPPLMGQVYGHFRNISSEPFTVSQFNFVKQFPLSNVGDTTAILSLEVVGQVIGESFNGKLDFTTKIGKDTTPLTRETLYNNIIMNFGNAKQLHNFATDSGMTVEVELVFRIYGEITHSAIIPPKTTYNVDFLNEQQHLLNTDDLSDLGEAKLNIIKHNFELAPNKVTTVRIKPELATTIDYVWGANDNKFFKLSNGFYLYGVIRFPLYREGTEPIDISLVHFLASDASNNLFVYIPILVSDFINPYFQNNTRANVEASFGDNLVGIISSPIPPTSVSDKAISIKALFNRPPYTTGDTYLKMCAFVVPSFKNSVELTTPKTPYNGKLYSEFTPPTSASEIWGKKLTTLDWENESILNSPQYLEYYLTNGSNQININNYVNVTYSDLNYFNISWGLTPISSIIFVEGLFDINRYEAQKNVLTYSGILPSNSSSYNQWILENSSSINMGLASAKATRDKEMAFGGMDILGGIGNMLLGGFMGKRGYIPGQKEQFIKLVRPHTPGRRPTIHIPKIGAEFGSSFFGGTQVGLGGIQDTFGGIDRMVTADLNYKNYQRQISGMNSDAQTKSSIITSDDSTYINTFSAISPLAIIYMGLKPNDCKTVWWNCFINGYNVNRQFNFNEYDNRTYFNYFSVTDISPYILSTKDVPQEYKDWFISKFEEGVRLWKTWMTFNIDNKEKFVDKIDNSITYAKR